MIGKCSSRQGVIEVVRIFERMRQYELGPVLKVDVDQFIKRFIVDAHRVIAKIEENSFSAEDHGGRFGLLTALSLHLVKAVASLFPEFSRLTAFAV